MIELSWDAVHEAAIAATGLSDFGRDDYRDGLGRLIDEGRESPHRDKIGARLADEIVDGLTRRLRSEEGWKAHPECLGTRLLPPLVITGLPRTGTTALHHLLSMDEQFQWLPHWVAAAPVIRPPREEWAHHPFYQAAIAALAAREEAAPGARAAHNVAAELADECIEVLFQSFVTMRFVSTMPLPRYHQWFFDQDETPSYRRFADNLRLIGALEPDKPWLLKNPTHGLRMAELLTVFPDARVVITYRDPVASIASGASVISLFAPWWEPHALGQHRLNICARSAARVEIGRAKRPDQFLDVDFRTIDTNPMQAVYAIYDRFGLTLTSEAEHKMRRWVEQNPRGKHGEHRYRLEQFGLSREEIRERLAGYIERYGL